MNLNPMKKNKPQTASDLIGYLWPEVFQTEESARTHPIKEAKRLGNSPPGAAMLAVSRHAESALADLKRLAKDRNHELSVSGQVIGKTFSILRSFGSDLVMSEEKSYRGTILGCHHGIGVFTLLEQAAKQSGDDHLATYCASWLQTRKRLVESAEEALGWFAEHPGRAAS